MTGGPEGSPLYFPEFGLWETDIRRIPTVTSMQFWTTGSAVGYKSPFGTGELYG
jgi:hypothetical protein